MLKFVLYEDNKNKLEEYATIINKVMMKHNFDYRIFKYSSYTKELYNQIHNDSDQKIFVLDIQVSDVSGLEIASKIREVDWKSMIVFITSYPQHKNDIFYSRLLAMDYIMKDYNYVNRLKETIEVCINALGKQDILVYSFNRVVYRVLMKNIAYIERAQTGKKNYIVTLDGAEYEIPGTMTSLEKKLGSRFFRSHKSCIVNLDNIKNINYSENTITFINDEEIDLLSVRSKKELRKICNK